MNMVQSKLGIQLPQLDWFSDLGCKTKRVGQNLIVVPIVGTCDSPDSHDAIVLYDPFKNCV